MEKTMNLFLKTELELKQDLLKYVNLKIENMKYKIEVGKDYAKPVQSKVADWFFSKSFAKINKISMKNITKMNNFFDLVKEKLVVFGEIDVPVRDSELWICMCKGQMFRLKETVEELISDYEDLLKKADMLCVLYCLEQAVTSLGQSLRDLLLNDISKIKSQLEKDFDSEAEIEM